MIEEPEIFKIAAALPTEERAPYLDAACCDQPGARERVEELLRHHDSTGFMDVEAIASRSPEIEAELARLRPEEPGDRLGHYTLVEQIGEGGFGTVWVADQDMPVRRRVALKIIKLGMDTKEVVARFEQERQALALMDHPNIAKVLDAGATPHGRPFFVMELVRGTKITEYCDQANLPTAERLELFIAVCNAVQHAHQKGIIHRDLKPSNILVTIHDGVPVPKVIDFGVAKATQQGFTELTIYTQLEQMIGTPLYMSPEQAEMSGVDIDTRSDIYSLGVLLYELLTGRTPFDPEELRRAGIDEIRRVIREQEPATPSVFLKTMAHATRISVAQRRQSDPEKLTKLVRGDLDWIVMKALEKDRTRRYETANSLAADLLRHLAFEPIVARPPSAGYRFQRLVKRNKVTFVAAGAVVLALIVGLAIATRSFLLERDARSEMRQQRDKAHLATVAERTAKEESLKRLAQLEKANEILTSVFAKLDPRGEKRGDKLLAAELGDRLVEAANQLEGEAVGDPLVVVRMQLRLGKTLTNLSLAERAIPMLTKARETSERLLGLNDKQTIFSIDVLAWAYHDAGNLGQALPLFQQALELNTKLLGDDDLDTLNSMNSLALSYAESGKDEEAAPYFKKVYERRKEKLGEDNAHTLESMNNLALSYQYRDKLDEALPLFVEALRLKKEKLSPDHPDTLLSMGNLAQAYQAAGNIKEALELLEDTLQLKKGKLSDTHWSTLRTMTDLASAWHAAKNFEKALPQFEKALELELANLGIEHPLTRECMDCLAAAYRDAGTPIKALPHYEKLLELREKKYGPNDPRTLNSLNLLALACQEAAQSDRALTLLKKVVMRYRFNAGQEPVADLAADLGSSYAGFLKKHGPDQLPSDPPLLADMAAILLESGNATQAAAVAQRALNLQPGNEEAAKVLKSAQATKPADVK